VVATEEWPGETATVGVWISAGSSYENDKNNGVAHFLEHMAFKGTKGRSQKKLELEIENIGAHLNAYTSREHTVFFAKSCKEDIPQSLDILADVLQNSTFQTEQIERERGTIIREANEVNNNMEEVIFDHLHAAAYQGTSLGRTILGTEENIKSIQQSDLKEYVSRFYTAPRMAVIAAGGIKHEDIVKQVEKGFANLPSTDSIVETPVEFTGSAVLVRNDDMPLAHIAIGVEGVGWTHPDYFAMLVINTMLGSWDRSVGGGINLASRLCEIVATEQLAHSITAFYTTYQTTALFGNYFVCPPEKIENTTYEVLNEWQRIANQSSASEVERAKSKLKAGSLMQLDGTTSIAEDIGRQILTIGRRLSPAEVWLRINDVTASDVRRVATTYLSDVSPVVAAIGPIGLLPDYNQIRGWTYWNRI